MTSAFVEEIQTLLDDLRRKERSLELITKFIETGGAHRLSISVDHPDPEVKAAIETIAARNIPSDLLIKGFTKFAQDDAAIARSAVVASALVYVDEAPAPMVKP